jgi:hypothetical protein
MPAITLTLSEIVMLFSGRSHDQIKKDFARRCYHA